MREMTSSTRGRREHAHRGARAREAFRSHTQVRHARSPATGERAPAATVDVAHAMVQIRELRALTARLRVLLSAAQEQPAVDDDAPAAPAARRRAALLRSALGVLAAAILVFTFLRVVSFGAVANRVAHLRVGLALLCGGVFLGAFVIRALRWRCLLRPYEVSVRRAVGIYQVAIFINWLLPIRAGEVAKSLLLRRTDGVPVSRSLAAVSIDKAMDLLPAVVLLAILPFAGLRLSRPLWLLLFFALAVVGTAAVVLALMTWRREKTMATLGRALRAVPRVGAQRQIESFVVGFVDTLVALVRRPRLLLVAVAYTAVAVGLDALFCLLAFEAVGVAISVPVVLYGYTLYNLAYMLPTPPGQIGSNEIIGLLIFSGVFGLSKTGVAAMFVFSHPWTAILMATSGLLCLSAMGLTLRSTLRLASATADGAA